MNWNVMRLGRRLSILAGVLLLAAGAPHAQSAGPQPRVLSLLCEGGDCPLLSGAPQTAGVRSGYVRLKSGQSVGWHSTGDNEEVLVVLRGHGTALVEGQPERSFAAPASVYMPPATRHNMKNTGAQELEYVWIVAPVRRR